MKWCAGWMLLTCLVWLSPMVAAAQEPFPWPEGRKAAVNLAYDDALDSQLDIAIPALDRHGLKGSFYLALGAEPVRLRMEEWRVAARNGHELGNHTLFHQCSGVGEGREWVQPPQDLAKTSIEQMRQQIVLGNTMLHALDGSTEFTFTAPCGDYMAQDGNYIDAVKDQFLGIKRVFGHIDDMATMDPAATAAIAPVDFTGEQLIELVDEAARRGTLIAFTFHGIGGDHLQTSAEAHEALLAYLASRPDVFWVDTFRNQMRWIRQQRE